MENKMNTKIGYLYRDASNYKKWNEVIVSGQMNKEDLNFIAELIDSDGFFIPEQIGLPLIRPDDSIGEDDHCFAELSINDITLTDEEATINLTWNAVIEGFKKANDTGWIIPETFF